MLLYLWIDTHQAFMNRNTTNSGIKMILETYQYCTIVLSIFWFSASFWFCWRSLNSVNAVYSKDNSKRSLIEKCCNPSVSWKSPQRLDLLLMRHFRRVTFITLFIYPFNEKVCYISNFIKCPAVMEISTTYWIYLVMNQSSCGGISTTI